MGIGYLPVHAERQTANALSNKRFELKTVQSKISESNKNLSQLHEQQEVVQRQLAEIDNKYAQLVLSLKKLQQQFEQKKQSLTTTQLAITTQQRRIDEQKRSLTDQVKTAHRMGKHGRLKLLLNQEDLALSSRILVYYDYLNKERSKKVAKIDGEVKQLVQLKFQQQQDKLQLTKVLNQKQIDQALLLETKQARTLLLSRLTKKYLSGRETLRRLHNDERQLISLLAVLQREAEQQRIQAEVRAKPDTDKKTQEGVKAQSKRQVIEQQQERSGNDTAPDQAKDEGSLTVDVKQNAGQVQITSTSNRLNKMTANKARKDNGATAKSQDDFGPATVGKSFAQLRGQLPWPLRGKMLETFGSSRFEGKWDGVLIGAGTGKEVRAVADGRVVYAAWLRSYGLLIIVNHGGGYMTVYAFNESLYKGVGAAVRAGEVIASVGQSGGRSEPALYFEIRRQGKPLDPFKWCKK